DAFKLRDFHGVIEKVENPDDRTILELYTMNHQPYAESVFARWEEDMKMLEKEHNLWEY
ncbi:MAG: gliding motility protein GldN, partial [Candidatus Nephrothrix sp. EaCA]